MRAGRDRIARVIPECQTASGRNHDMKSRLRLIVDDVAHIERVARRPLEVALKIKASCLRRIQIEYGTGQAPVGTDRSVVQVDARIGRKTRRWKSLRGDEEEPEIDAAFADYTG